MIRRDTTFNNRGNKITSSNNGERNSHHQLENEYNDFFNWNKRKQKPKKLWWHNPSDLFNEFEILHPESNVWSNIRNQGKTSQKRFYNKIYQREMHKAYIDRIHGPHRNVQSVDGLWLKDVFNILNQINIIEK